MSGHIILSTTRFLSQLFQWPNPMLTQLWPNPKLTQLTQPFPQQHPPNQTLLESSPVLTIPNPQSSLKPNPNLRFL